MAELSFEPITKRFVPQRLVVEEDAAGVLHVEIYGAVYIQDMNRKPQIKIEEHIVFVVEPNVESLDSPTASG